MNPTLAPAPARKARNKKPENVTLTEANVLDINANNVKHQCQDDKRHRLRKKLMHKAVEMDAQGLPYTYICAQLGISRVTLYRWRRREDYTKMRAAMLIMEGTSARNLIRANAYRAAQTLLQLMDSGSQAVALKAVLEVLKYHVSLENGNK